MKMFARYLPAVALFGALLAFAGCTTQTARAGSSRGNYQVAVIESSKGLQLTTEQVAEIRASALNYLKENGLTGGGEYVVKINLTPGNPEATDQWVVLRISSLPTRTYTLLAAYPGPDDSYPFDNSYYYGRANYRYAGLPQFGYYDPFDYGYNNNDYLGGGYTSPGSPPRNHRPDYKPGDHDNRPPVTHTRWEANPNQPDSGRTHSGDYQPRADAPRTWNHDRPTDRDSGSSGSGHGNSGGHTRTESSAGSGGSSSGSSSSPPPAPSHSAPEPAPRSEPARQTEKGETQYQPR
ncbi:MAG: hypothetical protein PSW75_02710 [bacterium]|nr:hypothetical protein [bacterium]MDI1335609.1 hypothetical protein [Lacunisphaera sp.]